MSKSLLGFNDQVIFFHILAHTGPEILTSLREWYANAANWTGPVIVGVRYETESRKWWTWNLEWHKIFINGFDVLLSGKLRTAIYYQGDPRISNQACDLPLTVAVAYFIWPSPTCNMQPVDEHRCALTLPETRIVKFPMYFDAWIWIGKLWKRNAPLTTQIAVDWFSSLRPLHKCVV